MNTRDHLVDHPLNHRIAVLCLVLLRTAATTGRADWIPPESSVTAPAVITVDVFAAPDLNGSYPSAPLVVGFDGALYGSTLSGGASGNGTLFRLETNGTFTTLHDFNGADGSIPLFALATGSDGALLRFDAERGIEGGRHTLQARPERRACGQMQERHRLRRRRLRSQCLR
jgi:uncharacterized repeat protein (TIGR03803 family)